MGRVTVVSGEGEQLRSAEVARPGRADEGEAPGRLVDRRRDPGLRRGPVDRHAARAGARAAGSQHGQRFQGAEGRADGQGDGSDRHPKRSADEPASVLDDGGGGLIGGGGRVLRGEGRAESRPDDGQLDRDMDDERTDGHPGQRPVDGGEAESEDVPTRPVGHTGDDLEEGAGDEDADRPPLEGPEWAPEERSLEEARVRGIHLGEKEGDCGRAARDVDPLGDAVGPRRVGRKDEEGQRVLLHVADQPGEEADPEGRAEPHAEASGHPRAVQG